MSPMKKSTPTRDRPKKEGPFPQGKTGGGETSKKQTKGEEKREASSQISRGRDSRKGLNAGKKGQDWGLRAGKTRTTGDWGGREGPKIRTQIPTRQEEQLLRVTTRPHRRKHLKTRRRKGVGVGKHSLEKGACDTFSTCADGPRAFRSGGGKTQSIPDVRDYPVAPDTKRRAGNREGEKVHLRKE